MHGAADALRSFEGQYLSDALVLHHAGIQQKGDDNHAAKSLGTSAGMLSDASSKFGPPASGASLLYTASASGASASNSDGVPVPAITLDDFSSSCVSFVGGGAGLQSPTSAASSSADLDHVEYESSALAHEMLEHDSYFSPSVEISFKRGTASDLTGMNLALGRKRIRSCEAGVPKYSTGPKQVH